MNYRGIIKSSPSTTPLVPWPRQKAHSLTTRRNWLGFFCVYLLTEYSVYRSVSNDSRSKDNDTPSLCYSFTHVHRSIGYHNNPQPPVDSVSRLIYLSVYKSRVGSVKPSPSPSSLCYSLTHEHWSIGYRNIPHPLSDSTAKLLYLRVYDNRASTSKSSPSPSSLWYSLTLAHNIHTPIPPTTTLQVLVATTAGSSAAGVELPTDDCRQPAVITDENSFFYFFMVGDYFFGGKNSLFWTKKWRFLHKKWSFSSSKMIMRIFGERHIGPFLPAPREVKVESPSKIRNGGEPLTVECSSSSIYILDLCESLITFFNILSSFQVLFSPPGC